MASLFQRIPPLHSVVTFAQLPDDSDRIRALKAMCTVVLLFITLITISYFFVPGRSLFLKYFDGCAFFLELYGLIVLRYSRSVQTLFYAYIPPYLCVISFFILINGTTEGDFMGLIAVPCAAVAILGPHRSIPWFLVCFGAMIVIPIVDINLPTVQLASAVSEANPMGYLFHSPWKKPIGPVEGIAFAGIVFVIYFMFRSSYMQLDAAKAAVEVEKAKVDRLMAAVFPSTIAARLQEHPDALIAENIPDATILFADIVDFTPLASNLPADKVVDHLNKVFSLFDTLCTRHNVEKIKTIGDAYMAVAGLTDPDTDHRAQMAAFALDLCHEVEKIQRDATTFFSVRIGIHSGPVVAGVIGRSKPFYDVWGASVNTAARLESHGTPGKIQVTEGTKDHLATAFQFSTEHTVDLKGIGSIKAYFLEGKIAA